MGAAFQVLSGRATNPGTTITAVTMDTNDSNIVRATGSNDPIWLDQAWAMGATAGLIRVRSPKMHDANQAIRQRYNANNADPLLAEYTKQILYPQDTLTIEITGGGAETDMMSLLVYYENISGLAAQLRTWDQILPLIQNYCGQECNMTTGATAGQYGGAQALNASVSFLKANTWYAVLGYLVDVACGTVGLTGTDFGNLRIGGPGSIRNELTAGWFVDLDRRTGRPYIPVFNSANIGNITVDIATPATATAINVTWNLAELANFT